MKNKNKHKKIVRVYGSDGQHTIGYSVGSPRNWTRWARRNKKQ